MDVKLENNEVGPGETGNVAIALKAGTAPLLDEGYSLVVQTSDPLMRQVTFRCQGRLRQELVIPKSIRFSASDPAESTQTEFIVYSQLWNEFSVEDIQCDLQIFDWNAEPITVVDSEFVDKGARSAWKIRLWTTAMDYGKYKGTLTLTARPEGQRKKAVANLTCHGVCRSPIVFHSPRIHESDGLDIGTLVAGEEHQIHLLVRLRGDLERKIGVLDVKPDELQASLAPLETEGDYRLTVTVPADCPTVVFNAAEKHGYVSVGDPIDHRFSNWFPLHGAVVELDK